MPSKPEVLVAKIQKSVITITPVAAQKEVKPDALQMKMVSSFQYYPRTEQEKGFLLHGDWTGLDSSKLFKEELE